jgi:hypothetical protein
MTRLMPSLDAPIINAETTWQQILLFCLQPDKSPEVLAQIRAVTQQPQFNWSDLVSYAHSQGVLLLLHEGLNHAGAAMPQSIAEELQMFRRARSMNNISLLQELARVIQILTQHNIPVLTFKGPTLALTAYQNIGLRQFGDLDILVRSQDFLRSLDLLVDVGGYQRDRQLTYLKPQREAQFLMADHEASLSRRNANIDVHQSMLPGYFLRADFEFESLYAQATSINLGQGVAKTLSAEDMLLYLCIHGSKECWSSLKWVCDIAMFIHTHPDLDWLSILHKADHLCGKRIVFISLLLANRLLATELPAILWDGIYADRTAQTATDYFITHLFQPHHQSGFSFTVFRLYVWMMEHWHDRLNLVRYLARPLREAVWAIPPTSRDQEWMTLPPQYHKIYYFLRPIRLTSKFFGWFS